MFSSPAAIAENLILRSAEGAPRRMIQNPALASAIRGRFAAPQGEGLGRIWAVRVSRETGERLRLERGNNEADSLSARSQRSLTPTLSPRERGTTAPLPFSHREKVAR